MSEKTNGEHPDPTCGRCGHPKSEHVAIPDLAMALICPTALFVKDQLQELLDAK